MSSVFSFLGSESDEEQPSNASDDTTPADETITAETASTADDTDASDITADPALSLQPAALSSPLAAVLADSKIDFDQVIADMLAALESYLPPPAGGLPDPSVNILQINEKPLAMGNLRGMERRSLLAPVVLKGGRLDVLVDFRLWGNDEAGANGAIASLQARLLHARDDLWRVGILRLTSMSGAVAEQAGTSGPWRRSAAYRLLYEYHYEDTDEAQSLIARIPVNTDPEEREIIATRNFHRHRRTGPLGSGIRPGLDPVRPPASGWPVGFGLRRRDTPGWQRAAATYFHRGQRSTCRLYQHSRLPGGPQQSRDARAQRQANLRDLR